MQYELRIEDVNAVRRRLHFSLPEQVVKVELDSAYLNLKTKVRLPGFRPGKVPRQVLEGRFAADIESEVSGRLIDRSYRKAAESLDVVGSPTLEDRGPVSATQGFHFVIGVDVKPAIQVQSYKGLQVEYKSVLVSEQDVDRAVQGRLASRASIQEVTEDRGVESGDLVLTSLKLSEGDAVVVDDPGTLVNTRAERYYPGVESLLLGLKKGESASGEVTIGGNSLVDAVKGRSLKAEVTVVTISANKVPELTDELAAELKYEGGVEGMRLALRLQLQQQADETGRTQARVAMLEKLVSLNVFEVPDSLVEEQLNALVEELRVRRAYQGQNPNSIRFSDAEMADLRGRARFAARAAVILSSVARAEGIAVTDADLDAKIREIAQMRGQTPHAIRGYLEKEQAIPVLKDRVLEEKTLEWLLENSDLQPLGADGAPEAPAETSEQA
jgi:trigger factor